MTLATTTLAAALSLAAVTSGQRRRQAYPTNHHDGELSPPMMKGACGGVSGRVPVRETSSERSLLVWRSHPDS